MMHAASRHRDVLDDYRRDFVRTRVGRGVQTPLRLITLNKSLFEQKNVEAALARTNLLGSIRKDIK